MYKGFGSVSRSLSFTFSLVSSPVRRWSNTNFAGMAFQDTVRYLMDKTKPMSLSRLLDEQKLPPTREPWTHAEHMFQSAVNNLLAKNKFEKAYGVLGLAHDCKVSPLIREEIYKQIVDRVRRDRNENEAKLIEIWCREAKKMPPFPSATPSVNADT